MISWGWVVFIVAIIWFVSMEYVRGRPGTSQKASFVMKWISPVGLILLLLVANACLRCRA